MLWSQQTAKAWGGQEQHIAAIYNTVRDVIFHLAVEPEGEFRFVTVNAAFLRATGLSLESVVGKTVNEVVPEPSLTMVLGKYRQAVEEKTIVLWEETSDYPAGRLTGEVCIAPVFDSQGTCTHLVGSVHDITERKRAAEAVRTSEERFRSIFENSAVGIALTDLRGFFVATNRAYQQLVGYTEEELRSLSHVDITYEEDRSAAMALGRELVQGKLPHFAHEKRYRRKDGKLIWVRNTISLVPGGERAPRFGMAIVEDITEAKFAEEALRENEERRRAILHTAMDGFWVADMQGRLLEVNESYCRMSGYSAEELLAMRISDLETKETASDTTGHIQRLKAHGEVRFESRHCRKDGSILDVEISTQYEPDEGSQMVTFLRDITERKRAERILKASEEKYRALVETTDTGYLIVDKEGKVIDANQEYVRLTGLDGLGEILGRSVIEWTAVHDKQRNAEAVARCVKDGFIRNLVIDYVDGDNRVTPVEVNATVTGSGESMRIISLCRDITERKRAEDALRESEGRFRNIADTCPAIIWRGGPDQQVTFINKQAVTFSGRSMDELLGTGWFEMVHPEDLASLHLTLASAVADRHSFQTEIRMRRHDGVYRWFYCIGVPGFAGDAYAEHMGISFDITDLKRNQEQVLEAQKLESLGVLAGGIAHDFNNMLGSILATSELVLSELPAGSTVAAQVNDIKLIATRTAEIVRQLLAYAGREGTRFEPVDLSLLVGEMLELLRASISKGAVLKISLAGNLPAVRANTSQMRQLVMNLITNASEALGEDGGVITVTTAPIFRRLGSAAESGTDLADRDYIRLEVSDSGCGMRKQIQARIFDPFFTTKFAGRGLGLAAVQGIVRTHDGKIEVESAPGQGTRIAVLLPCAGGRAADDHAAALNLADKNDANAANGTVLFVEDEEMLRTPTSKMLRKKGFSILEAGDGIAAVDLFRINESRIGVVLLDLTLPGMSGKDVLAELRRIRPGVRVVLTTAYSEEMTVTAVGGQHHWSFIRKPYRIADLARHLQDALSV